MPQAETPRQCMLEWLSLAGKTTERERERNCNPPKATPAPGGEHTLYSFRQMKAHKKKKKGKRIEAEAGGKKGNWEDWENGDIWEIRT